jgi:hypothetical protein
MKQFWLAISITILLALGFGFVVQEFIGGIGKGFIAGIILQFIAFMIYKPAKSDDSLEIAESTLDSIVDLQTALMKDDSQTYPHKIYSIIDIDRWVYQFSEYEIHKHDPVSHMHDQMYTKFLMKTDIININNPYQHQDVEDTYDGNKIATHATIPIIPIVSTTADGRIL